MWIGMLGSLLIRHEDSVMELPAARQRVVLAVLLVHANRVVPAGELADIVWDGSPPPGARVTTRGYVRRLRLALGPAMGPRIVTRAHGYEAQFTAAELDLLRFAELCSDGGAALRASSWRQAWAALGEALGLWRDRPMCDVPCQRLQHEEVPRLEQMRLQAAEWRAEAGLHLGHHELLVPELQALAAGQPLRERLHAQLMIALARCGRPAEALSAYQHARHALAGELGVEPGPELRRLHQQILQQDPGLSGSSPAPGARDSAAVRAPQVIPRQLPSAVRHFIGRADELKALTTLLEEAGGKGTAAVISAISGLAGIGKTTLAVHWAHQVADRFPDGQLYADLRGFSPDSSPVTPAEALGGFLDALGLPAAQMPAGLDARAARYRSLLAGRRVLVVLDNARHATQVRPLLPGSPGCLAIVTSRNQLDSLAASTGASLLILGLLSEADSSELLTAIVGSQRAASAPDAAAEIAGLCGRLPLALAIAAARAAAHPSLPLAALATKFRGTRDRLDALNAGDPVTSVRAVFSWSSDQLTGPAARMFRLLGVHPGPDISAPAAASLTGTTPAQARRDLAELARACLVTEHVPGRYGLHDLLRAYATEQARACDSGADRRAATGRLLDHYLHTANTADLLTSWKRDPITLAAPQPGVSPETSATWDQVLAWLDAERAVLVTVTRLAAETGFNTHAWQLASGLAVFFRMRGHWHDLVATQRIALGAAMRLRDPKAQALVHRELGLAIAEAGRFRQARSHLGRALQLYQTLGDQDGQARARISIGLVLGRQGRDREALDSTLAALRPPPAGKQPPGKAVTRVTQAIALNNLGEFHAQLGELPQARIRCERALQLFRDLGFPYGQALTLDSLGYIYHQQGAHDRAIAHYQRAADLYRQIGNLYELMQTLARLGDSCQAAADTAAAHDAWHQAMHILDGMHHPDAAQIRTKLRRLDSINSQAG